MQVKQSTTNGRIKDRMSNGGGGDDYDSDGRH